MSKVITFSTVFPSYHPRKGEPTYFVEKIWRSYCESIGSCFDLCSYQASYDDCPNNQHEIGSIMDVQPKHHTIRAGNRWKAGDKFSPRIWSGRPYNSPQLQIAPDMEIKKVWDIEIHKGSDGVLPVILNSNYSNGMSHVVKMLLAENDGLTWADFSDWFKIKEWDKPFVGQIICWDASVDYNS